MILWGSHVAGSIVLSSRKSIEIDAKLTTACRLVPFQRNGSSFNSVRSSSQCFHQSCSAFSLVAWRFKYRPEGQGAALHIQEWRRYCGEAVVLQLHGRLEPRTWPREPVQMNIPSGIDQRRAGQVHGASIYRKSSPTHSYI